MLHSSVQSQSIVQSKVQSRVHSPAVAVSLLSHHGQRFVVIWVGMTAIQYYSTFVNKECMGWQYIYLMNKMDFFLQNKLSLALFKKKVQLKIQVAINSQLLDRMSHLQTICLASIPGLLPPPPHKKIYICVTFEPCAKLSGVFPIICLCWVL